MLLEFDLDPVRVVDEKLQYSISSTPFYREICDPVCAKFLSYRLDVICLKAKMTEQSFLVASIRFLKELKKASATHVEKKSISLASRVSECMGNLKPEDAHVKSFGGRQVA
jgi:hypothetical protein